MDAGGSAGHGHGFLGTLGHASLESELTCRYHTAPWAGALTILGLLNSAASLPGWNNGTRTRGTADSGLEQARCLLRVRDRRTSASPRNTVTPLVVRFLHILHSVFWAIRFLLLAMPIHGSREQNRAARLNRSPARRCHQTPCRWWNVWLVVPLTL